MNEQNYYKYMTLVLAVGLFLTMLAFRQEVENKVLEFESAECYNTLVINITPEHELILNVSNGILQVNGSEIEKVFRFSYDPK